MGELVVQLRFTNVTEAQALTIKNLIATVQLPQGVTVSILGSNYSASV